MKITILTEKDLRKCVQLDKAALDTVAEGFTQLTEGNVTVPPIMRVDVLENHGEVDVKTAYIAGMDSFAIKMASGFHDNRLKGLPTGSGLMILISAETGIPMAVLLDNGYLTDVRTGIAGAIAAQHLGRKGIETVGVIGSGMQARFQMEALKIVRDYQRLYVYGIISAEVDQYAREMADQLGVEVIQAKDAETVVRESEILVTATPSQQPYLQADWLHPGLHITCMGSDSEHKQELFPDVFDRADLVVCDRKSQAFRLGELHHAKEAGIITNEGQVIELGELTSGIKPGRQDDDQITICDLTGVGVQDTQIARLAYREAQSRGLGYSI
ncbi:MAG: cyclodeaminase [Anaerolineales bacterium]